MKLNKLNLKGKGELLNEFELKEIKGGYYQTTFCSGPGGCSGSCDNGESCNYTTTGVQYAGCYCWPGL